MKDHIPLTDTLRAEIAALEQRKTLLIQGFLMAHDITAGNWQLLADGSAFVLTEAPVQEN